MNVTAVVSLAFVSSITPGPNNLMLWASGMNHGVRRTLRHLTGVSLGFCLLVFVVALGLGSAFERYPAIEIVLKVAGGGYLTYLAYRIFTAGSVTGPEGATVPLTFTAAALFQWVNPKAWVMAVTATSTLLDPDRSAVAAAALLTAAFGIVNLPCITAWMLSGAASVRWIDQPGRVRATNRLLGILLAGTVVLVVA